MDQKTSYLKLIYILLHAKNHFSQSNIVNCDYVDKQFALNSDFYQMIRFVVYAVFIQFLPGVSVMYLYTYIAWIQRITSKVPTFIHLSTLVKKSPSQNI